MNKLDVKKMGKLLTVLREEVSSSREDFAERIDIPAYTYARYERGDAENPPFEHMVRIAKELSISVDDLAELGGMIKLSGDPLDPTEIVLGKIRNFLADLDEPLKQHFIRFYDAQTDALRHQLSSIEPQTAKVEDTKEKYKDFPESFKRRHGLAFG